MTHVRMAAFDLDGTLLEHGALTRQAIRMLKILRQQGVLVVIATGRHRGTVPWRLHDPALADYLICNCGAVICRPGGEALWESTLSAQEVRDLMALGQPFHCTYAASRDRTTYLSKAEPLRRRKVKDGDRQKYFWRYYMYLFHSRRIDGSWADILQDAHFTTEKLLCVTARPLHRHGLRAGGGDHRPGGVKGQRPRSLGGTAPDPQGGHRGLRQRRQRLVPPGSCGPVRGCPGLLPRRP